MRRGPSLNNSQGQKGTKHSISAASMTFTPVTVALTNTLPWDAQPELCPVLLPILVCQVASRKVLERVTIPDACKLHLCLVDLPCHPYRLQGCSRGHSSSPLKALLSTPVAPCGSHACFLHPRHPFQVLMGAPLRRYPFAFFSKLLK